MSTAIHPDVLANTLELMAARANALARQVRARSLTVGQEHTHLEELRRLLHQAQGRRP